MIEPPDSFSFEAFKSFQSQYEKPIKKNNRTLLQRSAVLNGTDITDMDDPILKKTAQDDGNFPLSFSRNVNPSSLEKYIDCGNENLQPRTIQETYLPVIKQRLKSSFFDPSFFKYTSRKFEIFLPPGTPLNIETILKNQKRDPDQEGRCYTNIT